MIMSSTTKKFIIFGAEYLIIFEGVIFLIVALQKANHKDFFFFVMLGIWFVGLALLVAHVLKKLFHKKRPPKKEELFVPGDTYAFPSEHATSLAAFSFIMFRESYLWGSVALSLGLIIAGCRVLARVHRIQDVIIGGLLGVSVTYGTVHLIAPLVEKFF